MFSTSDSGFTCSMLVVKPLALLTQKDGYLIFQYNQAHLESNRMPHDHGVEPNCAGKSSDGRGILPIKPVDFCDFAQNGYDEKAFSTASNAGFPSRVVTPSSHCLTSSGFSAIHFRAIFSKGRFL